MRSSQTVLRYVHIVLHGVLTLHNLFLVKPNRIDDDCSDRRWKWFKNDAGVSWSLRWDVHQCMDAHCGHSTLPEQERSDHDKHTCCVIHICDSSMYFMDERDLRVILGFYVMQ